ncbi:MAG: Rab family GTPase [Candidatus Hodarchaeales archaeon]|jgi:small GTP-binding protein
MKKNDEYLLKICGIGHGNGLKTAFIQRFTENIFDVNYLPTLGVDITTKRISIDEMPVMIILVDIAGEEEFRKDRPSLYRGASALIIFFIKGDRQSFNNVVEWEKEFKNRISAPVPIAIVGFQAEEEEVTTEEADNLAEQLNSTYFECNPILSGKEVNRVFQFLSRKVIEA